MLPYPGARLKATERIPQGRWRCVAPCGLPRSERLSSLRKHDGFRFPNLCLQKGDECVLATGASWTKCMWPAATNVAPVLALWAQTPYGTFGCGQAEKALLRTRHFDVLGKGMALLPARPPQPGLSHWEATMKRTGGKGRQPWSPPQHAVTRSATSAPIGGPTYRWRKARSLALSCQYRLVDLQSR